MVLTMRDSGEEPRTQRFDQETVVIGSDGRCDVVLAHDEVDARQAVLIPRENHVDLFDIGTSGGVLVNGQAVTHAEITPRDEVWIGSTASR